MKKYILKGMMLLMAALVLLGCPLPIDTSAYTPTLSIGGGVAIVGSNQVPTTAFTANAAGYPTTNYRYTWTLLDGDDEVIDLSREATYTPAAKTVTEDETMTINLTVTDGYTTASATTTYLISASTEPTAIINGGEQYILINEQVSAPFSVNYANFDNTPTITWAVTDDGDNPVAQGGTTNAVDFTPDAIATAGEYTLTVTLVDGTDNASNTYTLYVREAHPVDISFTKLQGSYVAAAAGTSVAPMVKITGTAGFGKGLMTDNAYALASTDTLEFIITYNTITGNTALDLHVCDSNDGAPSSQSNSMIIRTFKDQVQLFTAQSGYNSGDNAAMTTAAKTLKYTMLYDSGWKLDVADITDDPAAVATRLEFAAGNPVADTFAGGAYLFFAGLDGGENIDFDIVSINGKPLTLVD